MSNPDNSTCPTCGAPIPADAPSQLCPKCVLGQAVSAAGPTGTGGKGTPPPTVEKIAPHFPDLDVLELLGAGGMGAVYKARQPQLDRTVALKILSHDLAADPSFAERFNREARMLARLNHPNIVGIHDFGTAGPYCYLLMEFVDGVNLRQAMQAGGFTPAESLPLVQDICSALKFAHDEGILHRDIKPENVLIDSKGRVKIADFGIAKLVGEDGPELVTLTMQGSVLGSPHYMAPEQIETPADVDQRADIYSLGVVFYELLTGELPIGRFAPPSEKADMDARIDEIVLRTLEKERQARFQSAEEVSTQVEAVATSPQAATPAAAPGRHDEASARFSLTAAILTGLSLLLVAVTIFYANVEPNHDDRLIGTVIGLVVAGGIAIVGFILGAVALGDIHRSGGRKSGLGSSVFATVVWPFLLSGMVMSLFLYIRLPAGMAGGGFGPIAIIPFIGIPQILILVVLVRGLRRWAGGVPTENGGRRHPGLGRSLLLAGVLIILGPLLLVVTSLVLPAGERPDPFAEAEREMELDMQRAAAASIRATGASLPQGFKWHRGAPEAVLSVQLASDVMAEFRLVRTDAEGTPEYVEVGKLRGDPSLRRSELNSQIRIGTSAMYDDGPAAERGFAALLGYTGDSGILHGESDFDGWKFEEDNRTPRRFAMAGNFVFRIATRREAALHSDKVTGVLNLEVIVTEQ